MKYPGYPAARNVGYAQDKIPDAGPTAGPTRSVHTGHGSKDAKPATKAMLKGAVATMSKATPLSNPKSGVGAKKILKGKGVMS